MADLHVMDGEVKSLDQVIDLGSAFLLLTALVSRLGGRVLIEDLEVQSSMRAMLMVQVKPGQVELSVVVEGQLGSH